MKLSHVKEFITYAPIILLVVLAFNHLRLARVYDASPWHGGSFGMFAVLDGFFTRSLVVNAVVNGQAVKVDLSTYADEIENVVLFPTDEALRTFATKIACNYNLKASGNDPITLLYYKSHFDVRTLQMRSELQREVTMVRCDK